MSAFPCASHGTRVTGPLASVYITVLRGAARFRSKQRLCSPCLADLLERKAKCWRPTDDVGVYEYSDICDSCRQTSMLSDGLDPVFVTVYPGHDERQDYFARVCGACGDDLITELSLKP